MPDQFYNIVTFKPDHPPEGGPTSFQLALDGEFSLKAGVDPDINSFLVPHHVFDAMKITDEVTGTLQFWYRQPTGEPDYSIGPMTIIDVEPVSVGQVVAGGPVRIVSYRLFIADLRHRFIAPRGGWLGQGKINAPKSSLQLRNSELIDLCMKAMGFGPAGYDLDASVDDDPPIQDLEWKGNHAPGELKKILDDLSAAFVVKSDGRVSIEKMGTGAEPTIPADQKVYDLALPGLDRRGKTVVFSSSPFGIISSITIKGPNVDTWLMVARDKDGDWKDVNRLTITEGRPAADVINSDFRLLTSGKFGSYYSGFYQEVFRCIRLNNEKYPGFTILRNLITKDSNNRQISVQAKIARYDKSTQTWMPGTELVQCTPALLYQEEVDGEYQGVIRTQELLAQVTEPTPSINSFIPEKNVRALADGELVVKVSAELVEVVDGKRQPKYFNVGYRAKLGGVERLSEDELKGALLDPQTILVSRPDLILYMDEGQPTNLQALLDATEPIAKQYLRGSGKPREVSARGYCQVELSGIVGEIKISQRDVRTTLRLEDWHIPSGGIKVATLRKLMQNAGKFPAQAQTEEQRTAWGTSSAVQPVVPLNPAGGGGGGGTISVVVKIISYCEGDEKYICRVWQSPTASIDRKLPLTEADLGTDPGSDFPAIAENVARTGQKGHWVPLGIFMLGQLRGSSADTSPLSVVAVQWDIPPGNLFKVNLTQSSGMDGDKDHAPTYNYNVSMIDQVLLLQNIGPEVSRPLGSFNPATVGTAYVDVDGTPVLFQAMEIPNTTTCPTGS